MSNSYIGGLGPPSQNSAGVLDRAYPSDLIELHGSRQRTLGHFDHGRVFVPAAQMLTDSTGVFNGNGSGYVEFPPSVNTVSNANVDLSAFSTGSLKITAYYTISSGSTAIVRWLLTNRYHSSTSAGDNLASTASGVAFETLAMDQSASSSGATAAGVLRTAVIRSTSDGAFDGNADVSVATIIASRRGSAAADTYGGTVRLHGLLVELVTT